MRGREYQVLYLMYPRARARVPYVPGCARAECGDQQRVAAARVLLHGQHCAPHPPARERACVLQVSRTERHRTAASRTSHDGRRSARWSSCAARASAARGRPKWIGKCSDAPRTAAMGSRAGIPASHWHRRFGSMPRRHCRGQGWMGDPAERATRRGSATGTANDGRPGRSCSTLLALVVEARGTT
jgi:hypothetical protein